MLPNVFSEYIVLFDHKYKASAEMQKGRFLEKLITREPVDRLKILEMQLISYHIGYVI
jgi:hypothetical protein